MQDARVQWLWRGLGLLGVAAGLYAGWRLLSSAGRIELLSTGEVELKRAQGAAIVDVRTPVEYRRGHIPGAISIPVTEMARRWHEVQRLVETQDREPVLICQHGPRAVAAALILRRHGLDVRTMLDGGMSSWRGPVER